MLYLYLVRNFRNLPSDFRDRIRSTFAPRPVYIVADIAHSPEPFRHPFTALNVYDAGPRKLLFDACTAYNMYRFTTVADGESASQSMMREADPVFRDWGGVGAVSSARPSRLQGFPRGPRTARGHQA